MAQTRSLHRTEAIRNVAMVGHAGSGKTSLVEALLWKSGAIPSAGGVAKGTTVSDFLEQEKQVGHSLEVGICRLQRDGTAVNILDTPGYPDFIGRSLSVLPAVETALVVVDACTGAQPITERMMKSAREHKLCRVIIVNKIDAPEADACGVLEQLTEAFGAQCLPLNLPARRGQAVADCFFEPADETPDFSSVQAAHTAITDQVIELDDALMERYLEQSQEIGLADLHDPFERALRRGHLIPVCFTSAETGAGIRQLLRIMSQLMPNPLESNPPQLMYGRGARAQALRVDPQDPDAHFIAHVFRIRIDPYVGRIAAFRVHQGSIRSGDQVYVGERRKALRLAHLYRLQGKDLEETPQAVAGEICAVTKLDDIEFGDVIHSSHAEDSVWMRVPELPAPMYGLALTSKETGKEKKLSDALHKLVAGDPSLRLELDAQTAETVLRGTGELHLRMSLERMREQFGADVVTRVPRTAYRETITAGAEGHHRHKKQTGGAGQFGEVSLRVEPLSRGAGFEFVTEVVGGTIPTQFIPAVEKGIRQVVEQGAIAGYPLQDLKVVVYDGKHHPVDSKEVAFIAAGRRAFIDAVNKARPVVLEPIARIEITTPSQHVGDVTGHLAGIRGRVAGTSVASDGRIKIEAQVPIAELGQYQTTLKSLTGGAGTFTLMLDHYEAAPPAVQESLKQAYRPLADD